MIKMIKHKNYMILILDSWNYIREIGYGDQSINKNEGLY